MSLPRLHAVAADHVLAAAGFVDLATALFEAGGSRFALHLRGHHTAAATMYAHAAALSPVAARSGAMLILNDRVDIALAVDGEPAVLLGRRSLPVTAARPLLGTRVIGYSAHEAAEAARSVQEGADFVLLGTIYATASHPGRSGAGVELVRVAAEAADAPVVAIGGITPERAADVIAAGAHGAAVLSGIFAAADPVAALAAYLDVLGGS